MARLTFHGHATCSILTDDGTTLLIDPWLEGNPRADRGPEDFDTVDAILCTHGHADHFGDVIPIALRTGALVIATPELLGYCGSKGVQRTHAMSVGGAYRFPFGTVKMVVAHHGGGIAGDGAHATPPVGFLLDLGPGKRVYHAGDTALTLDMQLLAGRVDLALLPIGDNFTMGPEDAARAVEFIRPGIVVPIHYDTFPVIRQNPGLFRDAVGERASVRVLAPGETLEF